MSFLCMSEQEYSCSACPRIIATHEPLLRIGTETEGQVYCFQHVIWKDSELFSTDGYPDLPEEAQLFLREWASSNLGRIRRKEWEVVIPKTMHSEAAPRVSESQHQEIDKRADNKKDVMESTHPPDHSADPAHAHPPTEIVSGVDQQTAESDPTTYGLRWSTENRKMSPYASVNEAQPTGTSLPSPTLVMPDVSAGDSLYETALNPFACENTAKSLMLPSAVSGASLTTKSQAMDTQKTKDKTALVTNTGIKGIVIASEGADRPADDQAKKEPDVFGAAVESPDLDIESNHPGLLADASICISNNNNHGSALSGVAFQGSRLCGSSTSINHDQSGAQGSIHTPPVCESTAAGLSALDSGVCSSRKDTQISEEVQDTFDHSTLRAKESLGDAQAAGSGNTTIEKHSRSIPASRGGVKPREGHHTHGHDPTSARELQMIEGAETHFLTAQETKRVHVHQNPTEGEIEEEFGTTSAYPYGSGQAGLGTTSAYTAGCYEAAHRPGGAENVERTSSNQPFGPTPSHLCYDYIHPPLSADALQHGQHYEPIVATKLWQLSQQALRRQRLYHNPPPPTLPIQPFGDYPTTTEYYAHTHPEMHWPAQNVESLDWMLAPAATVTTPTSRQIQHRETEPGYCVCPSTSPTQMAVQGGQVTTYTQLQHPVVHTGSPGTDSDVSVNTPPTAELIPNGMSWREYAVSEQIKRDSVYSIKKLLRRLGLVTTGNKACLLERIEEEAKSKRSFPERMRARHFQRRRAEPMTEQGRNTFDNTTLYELRQNNLKTKRLDQLKALCRRLGLRIGGTKAEIVERLQKFRADADDKALQDVLDIDVASTHT